MTAASFVIGTETAQAFFAGKMPHDKGKRPHFLPAATNKARPVPVTPAQAKGSAHGVSAGSRA